MAPRRPLSKRVARRPPISTTISTKFTKPTPTSAPTTTTPKSTTSTSAIPQSSRTTSKQSQRRQVRHNTLLSKLHATRRDPAHPRSSSSDGITKSKTATSNSTSKRRRPSKKLAGGANMASDLLNALPTSTSTSTPANHDRHPTNQDDSTSKAPSVSTSAKSRPTSTTALRSRPGVQKRREKVGRLERERWARNFGVLIAGNGCGSLKSQETGKEVETVEGVVPEERRGDNETEAESRAERWKALRAHIEGTMGTVR